MIRGPRRGLGTFRCRCRRSCCPSVWSGVSLLLLLSVPLLLLQAGRAAARVPPHPPQPDRVNPFRGPHWSGTGLPASDFAPPHLVFQSGGQLGRAGSMAGGSSGSGSRDSSSIAPMVQHHLQQLHHQKQQIGSGSSSLGGTTEASIIRLMSKQNNLYLEIYPNGTVGTTSQDSSYYTILEQSAVHVGLVRIRGVASRQYLCLNSCGRLYGSQMADNPDCILRENIEYNWYNTYTSVAHSTENRSLYMAIGTTGDACRLKLRKEKGLVVLGDNQRFTQFFPVRNISLPNGVALTSLIQNASNFKLKPVDPQFVGCAPRCKRPPKDKCRCKPNDTPNDDRCRRHCRNQLPRVPAASRSSNSSKAAKGGSRQGHVKNHRNRINESPLGSSAESPNLSLRSEDGPAVSKSLGSSRSGDPSLNWMELEQPLHNKKKKLQSREHERHQAAKQRKKQKDRRKMAPPDLKVRHSRQGHAAGVASSSKVAKVDGDELLLASTATGTKMHSRYRHMYRKIRAHPELFTEAELLQFQQHAPAPA